jgi:hypothetical protein
VEARPSNSVKRDCLWCRVCRMSGWDVAVALALPAPEIAWPIFVVLVLEWAVWPVAMQFLPDAPRCPICKSSFRWTEIDVGGSRSRPLSFPCPNCLQTIGAPSWRKSFLRAFYLSLIAIFMFVLFDLRGDLFLGYLGTLLEPYGLRIGSSRKGWNRVARRSQTARAYFRKWGPLVKLLSIPD